LTAEHAEALLREARKESPYLYAFLFFALKTGRRLSEILSIEWNDVDFGKEKIRYLIRKKKGGLEEFYRRPPKSVFQVLFKLRADNKEKPFPYFPRAAWRRVRDKVDKEMGLPDRRFHALRHRCATEMIENDATLYDVQYYLCHSSPMTTTIYAHVSDKRDEKIAAFLE
jgi:integrase